MGYEMTTIPRIQVRELPKRIDTEGVVLTAAPAESACAALGHSYSMTERSVSCILDID